MFTGTFDWEKQEVVVGEIWEYFSDGINFEDSSYGDNNFLSQPLGNWNKSIFDTEEDVDVLPSLLGDNNYYMKNSTFSDFKKKTGVGRDINIIGKRLHQDKFIRSIKFYNDIVKYE